MKPFYRSCLATVLCLAPIALASPASPEGLTLPRDGWASWEVAAVDGAPAWCCWSQWKDVSPGSCRLDRDTDSFGSRDNATTDTVRMYAHAVDGKIDRLRVLSATCPVDSATPIQDLGSVATDTSARWLIDLANAVRRSNFGQSMLAALAVHRSALAGDALAAIARTDARKETRKQAIFWLARLRGAEGANIVTSMMFDDQDADIREHAAFAITQSRSPRAAAELIRLGNTDREGRVRAQAWFWLAQMGAPEAETEIVAALKKDTDDHVRKHVMVALSQLPEDRSTKALIALVQDQTLARDLRKQAMFWLAQSQSAAAQAYLDKTLTTGVTN